MITWVDSVVARGPRPGIDTFPYLAVNVNKILVLDGDREAAMEWAVLWPMVAVVSFPISDWQIYNPFGGVSQSFMDKILEEMTGPAKIYVHCLHGWDRTGLVIAMYRVRKYGWSKDRAMAEAIEYGYHSFWNKGLNRTWKAFQG